MLFLHHSVTIRMYILMWLNWLKDRLKMLGEDSFVQREQVKLLSHPKPILVCTIFDKLWCQRKKAAYRPNQFVCTKYKFLIGNQVTRDYYSIWSHNCGKTFNLAEVTFLWQISYPPANGASLGSYLVKNGLFSKRVKIKIAQAAKLAYFTSPDII